MKQRAFTLIEVLIYLSLLVFFMLLSFGFYARVYLVAVRQSHELQEKIREVVAIDLLMRDLQSASCLAKNWDVENCVFVKQTLDCHGGVCDVCVGYQLGNHGLLRSEGRYDFVQRSWIERTAALVATHVRAITFQLFSGAKGAVAGVSVLCHVGQRNSERREQFFVALRNRVLA